MNEQRDETHRLFSTPKRAPSRSPLGPGHGRTRKSAGSVASSRSISSCHRARSAEAQSSSSSACVSTLRRFRSLSWVPHKACAAACSRQLPSPVVRRGRRKVPGAKSTSPARRSVCSASKSPSSRSTYACRCASSSPAGASFLRSRCSELSACATVGKAGPSAAGASAAGASAAMHWRSAACSSLPLASSMAATTAPSNGSSGGRGVPHTLQLVDVYAF